MFSYSNAKSKWSEIGFSVLLWKWCLKCNHELPNYKVLGKGASAEQHCSEKRRDLNLAPSDKTLSDFIPTTSSSLVTVNPYNVYEFLQ